MASRRCRAASADNVPPQPDCSARSRTTSNGPRSSSPSRASGSRRCALIRSASAATITSVRACAAGSCRCGSRRGRSRSKSRSRFLKSRCAFADFWHRRKKTTWPRRLDDADLASAARQIRGLLRRRSARACRVTAETMPGASRRGRGGVRRPDRHTAPRRPPDGAGTAPALRAWNWAIRPIRQFGQFGNSICEA